MTKPRIRPWRRIGGVQYYGCHGGFTSAYGPSVETAYWRWLRYEQQLEGMRSHAAAVWETSDGTTNANHTHCFVTDHVGGEDFSHSSEPDGKLTAWGVVTIAAVVTMVAIALWASYHIFDQLRA